MNERNADPAAHYDRVIEPWDLLLGADLHYGVFDAGNEPLPVATNALTQRMIDAANLSAGLDVLDVGCGSGAPACRLATEYDVSVLGISTSAVSVQSATNRAVESGLAEQARFEVRDGTDTGLPDLSFDRVWVLEASHLMRHKDRLLADAARVLRPGGLLVLCDIIRRRDIPFAEVKERRADFGVLRDAFGDAHMESLDVYRNLAGSAGLEVEQVADLTSVTLPTFARWRDNAATHHDTLVRQMGESALAGFVAACDILEAFWLDGTLGYGIFSASKPN